MKKLTKSYKKWLLHRARVEAKKPVRIRVREKRSHVVRAWYGEDIEEVVSENRPKIPPREICLSENADETLEFISEWRNSFKSLLSSASGAIFNWFKDAKSQRGRRRIEGYTDFSQISRFSTAPALVVTAEYDRLRILMDDVPPTINLDEWKDPVFRRLYEMGFFEILGLTESVSDRYFTLGDVRTMKIISGTNSAELAEASQSILGLCDFLGEGPQIQEDVELALNNALSEAMINVSKHAYPNNHDFKFRHVSKWWVTASVDRGSRELTVVIYDQGASIPVTFSQKNWSQTVRDFFKSVLAPKPSFEFENDGTYIEGAMRPRSSQTGKAYRGLGLPEMKDLVDICGRGSLRIFSRGGECYYEAGRQLQRRSRDHSIGGTLIEWTLHLRGG
ncbi:ATP-binding protein [Dinoroseobacter sp. S124A]|uniref:ATP-binding protein n=1 Tax=Dinoroseobacter sp. S124A TaxID=3415128 RepID=UPI003C7ACFBD